MLWTLTIENRAQGWLTPAFFHDWQLILLHMCSRFRLVCPAYVLMPDHAHLFLLGLEDSNSDQVVAVEFLRKHLRPRLIPADWQHQAHDRVLRDRDRQRDAFINVVSYVLDNPVRAGLAARRSEYHYIGCCVSGYPTLDMFAPDYWELFWRIYEKCLTNDPLAHARGYDTKDRQPGV